MCEQNIEDNHIVLMAIYNQEIYGNSRNISKFKACVMKKKSYVYYSYRKPIACTYKVLFFENYNECQ
jgi:hypothetical protein